MSINLPAGTVLLLASGLLVLPADQCAPAWGDAFTDVTSDCGVTKALNRHYQAHPQWWLSGLNLVGLDNDGHLDLFLSAHGAGRSLHW